MKGGVRREPARTCSKCGCKVQGRFEWHEQWHAQWPPEFDYWDLTERRGYLPAAARRVSGYDPRTDAKAPESTQEARERVSGARRA